MTIKIILGFFIEKIEHLIKILLINHKIMLIFVRSSQSPQLHKHIWQF
jgi:hypothetical protein